MNLVFFNLPYEQSFQPLTLTRPVADLRLGIYTIAEKWQLELGGEINFHRKDGFERILPFYEDADNLFISGHLLPTAGVVEQIKNLRPGQVLASDHFVIASRGVGLASSVGGGSSLHPDHILLQHPKDLLANLAIEIEHDLQRLSKSGESESLSDQHSVVFGDNTLFIEKGVTIKNATFDTTKGPIYLGPGATINPASVIEGPCVIGSKSTVMPQTYIRSGASIGPDCIVGGELKRVVIQGQTNKGHYGYLGDSIIGAFCNFGAGTTGSNLKNNYREVQLFDYSAHQRMPTGEMKLGMVMGDFVHTAIGSLLLTGSSLGTGSHIFGDGLIGPNFPPFSWGLHDKYNFDKFTQVAVQVKQFKGQELSNEETEFLRALWEKFRHDNYQEWQ